MTSNHKTLERIAILAVLTALAAVAAAQDQDWPQWRGPNRDGAVLSFRNPTSWPARLTELWKVEVGLGYATPLLVGDRVYMYTRQGEDEVMMALNAGSGEVIWRTSYPARFEMNPATSRHGPGPKPQTAVADALLFTLAMSGLVTPFDAETGKQIW